MLPRAWVLLIVLCSAAVLLGQDKPENKKPDKRGRGIAVTPEREAAVRAFVDQHHPDLAQLLDHLKGKKDNRSYERAVRELFAVSERLASLQESDQKRYELELKAWKTKSRIQLLAAKLTMIDDNELEQRLKSALAEQHEVRRQIMQLEKSRLRDRMKKIDKDLAEHDARRESAIEKQFKTLTSAGPKAGGKPIKPKPAKDSVGNKQSSRDNTVRIPANR